MSKTRHVSLSVLGQVLVLADDGADLGLLGDLRVEALSCPRQLPGTAGAEPVPRRYIKERLKQKRTKPNCNSFNIL